MTVPRIDWTVLWKLFQYHFFWIYAAIGIPLRFALVWRFKAAPAVNAGLYVVMSSFASSALCTWFPIVPITCRAALILIAGEAAGNAAGESIFIGVPLGAASMGIETALLDALLLRWLFKKSANRQFVRVLGTNVLNASIALALGLMWAFRHLPAFIAALD